MSDKWYIVQLSSSGEKEPSEVIAKAIRKVAGPGSEVFAPVVKGPGVEYKNEYSLLDGYVFVKPTRDPTALLRLEESSLFIQAVHSSEGRGKKTMHFLSDLEVDQLRGRLVELLDPEKIVVGDRVKILDGPYKNMVGEVVEVAGGEGRVEVDLRSKDRSPRIPLFCLTRKVTLAL